MNALLAAALTLLAVTARADSAWERKSAYRPPDVSYRRLMAPPPEGSVLAATVPLEQLNLSRLPEWPSLDVVYAKFDDIRDLRWLTDEDRPAFLRRSTWLYPDDGCFARAAMVQKQLAQGTHSLPAKVFVFGNLYMESGNALDGSVTWWYHVAPMVRVGDQAYVFDPSVEISRPLRFQEWLRRMASKAEQLDVAVCQSGAYTPYDQCAHISDGIELEAEIDQRRYLPLEWRRLEDLGRNPERELGDEPPWKSNENLTIPARQWRKLNLWEQLTRPAA